MEVLIIQKEAFGGMTAKLSRFTERVDGQPRSVQTAQHQSAHFADATRQRHADLFAD